MKVLIADDHAIVRKGLIQIVNSLPQVDLIDEAEDGFQVIEKFSETKYDLIILDLSMPKKKWTGYSKRDYSYKSKSTRTRFKCICRRTIRY